MIGNYNYIKNIIQEVSSSKEDSNSISILRIRNNSIYNPKYKIISSNKKKKIESNLDIIFSPKLTNEKSSFLKEKISNNLSCENNDINLSKIEGNEIDINTIINYNQALEYFYNLEFSKLKKLIKVEDFQEENCCKKFFICGKKTLKLNSELIKEREIIFCITKIPYNENNNIHFNILTTINNFLIEENYFLNNKIYYEKNDFTKNLLNNLRKVGMYGLLQILYFQENYSQFFKILYHFFVNNNFEYLFYISLINLVKICLNCLKNGSLIPICNRKKCVLNVINNFFLGLASQFYLQLHLNIKNKKKLKSEFIYGQIDDLQKLGDKTPNYILSKKFLIDKFNNIN
jgi:hypothetical protein